LENFYLIHNFLSIIGHFKEIFFFLTKNCNFFCNKDERRLFWLNFRILRDVFTLEVLNSRQLRFFLFLFMWICDKKVKLIPVSVFTIFVNKNPELHQTLNLRHFQFNIYWNFSHFSRKQKKFLYFNPQFNRHKLRFGWFRRCILYPELTVIVCIFSFNFLQIWNKKLFHFFEDNEILDFWKKKIRIFVFRL
jgi:hypothetical protein